ncbi:MAG: alpha/beta hydrolase [Candidatus Omnitrophica bacterium]|nr:alpha/beta hydrolase [Candidatus Omnitrophota bacterium]
MRTFILPFFIVTSILLATQSLGLAKTAPVDSPGRGEFFLSQTGSWLSESPDDRIDADDILEILRNWNQFLVRIEPLVEGTIGASGGRIKGSTETHSEQIVLEIPPNVFDQETSITLERILDPNTDPLAPTISISADRVPAGTTSIAVLQIPFRLEEARRWVLFPENDLRVVIRRGEFGGWEPLPTTVDIENEVLVSEIPFATTQVIVTASIKGIYYGGYHQPEGFLVLTGENTGGTVDLNAALNPSPEDRILILVHGILSNAEDTWTASPEDFPNTLKDCYDYILYAQYEYLRQDADNYSPLGRKCACARAARLLWKDLFSRTSSEGRANLAAAEVHLVGHSQGGVVSRWIIEEIPQEASEYRDLVNATLIDEFLSLDSPQDGVDFSEFCEPFSRKISQNICDLLNSFDEERILGTSFLNRIVGINEIENLEVFSISVEDDPIIPNESALFLTDATQEISVNLDGNLFNLGHSLVHSEMATNGAGGQVKAWFNLDCSSP